MSRPAPLPKKEPIKRAMPQAQQKPNSDLRDLKSQSIQKHEQSPTQIDKKAPSPELVSKSRSAEKSTKVVESQSREHYREEDEVQVKEPTADFEQEAREEEEEPQVHIQTDNDDEEDENIQLSSSKAQPNLQAQ